VVIKCGRNDGGNLVISAIGNWMIYCAVIKFIPSFPKYLMVGKKYKKNPLLLNPKNTYFYTVPDKEAAYSFPTALSQHWSEVSSWEYEVFGGKNVCCLRLELRLSTAICRTVVIQQAVALSSGPVN
jgi:hypothetical protein